MCGGLPVAPETHSSNGAGSLYSPLPSSGISERPKQGAGVKSRCDPSRSFWTSENLGDVA